MDVEKGQKIRAVIEAKVRMEYDFPGYRWELRDGFIVDMRKYFPGIKISDVSVTREKFYNVVAFKEGKSVGTTLVADATWGSGIEYIREMMNIDAQGKQHILYLIEESDE